MDDANLSKHFWLMKEIAALKKDLAATDEQYITPDNKSLIDERKCLLNNMLEKAALEVLKIEKYLDSIEDVQMRVLLRLRYVSRMTWEAIGKEIYMSPSGALRKCMRYFENN